MRNSSGERHGCERALDRFARDANIESPDLIPELIRKANDGAKLYFTLGGHLNDLGNEAVGQVAAEDVRTLLCQRVAQRRTAGWVRMESGCGRIQALSD